MKKLCMHSPRSRNGFNLIEAAIVLAVVGLVIGGIWVAAASVSYRLKEIKTAEGMLRVIQSVRELYKGVPCTVASTYLDPLSINLGVSDWPDAPAGGTTAVASPLGPPMLVGILCGSAYGDIITIHLGIGTADYDYAMCQSLTPRLGFKMTTPQSGNFGIEDSSFKAMGGLGHCSAAATNMGYYWKYLP